MRTGRAMTSSAPSGGFGGGRSSAARIVSARPGVTGPAAVVVSWPSAGSATERRALKAAAITTHEVTRPLVTRSVFPVFEQFLKSRLGVLIREERSARGHEI